MKAEDIIKANETLKTIDVKDKKYVQVYERIKAFRSICPNGTIKTEIVDRDEETVTMMTSIFDEDGHLLATGYAREEKAASFINKTSYIENCETSAVGRALGMCGIGVDGSMASAEEVANAILNQNTEPKAPKKEEPKKEAPKKDTKAEPKTAKQEAEEDLNRRVTKEEVQKIIAGCKENGVEVSKICNLYNKKSLPELSAYQFKHIFNNWERIKGAN